MPLDPRRISALAEISLSLIEQAKLDAAGKVAQLLDDAAHNLDSLLREANEASMQEDGRLGVYA